MTQEEIKKLPISEKIETMETIWNDFRDRIERAEPSPQIKALLDQRRVRVRDSSAKILDWDSAKHTIGRA